MSAAAGLTTPPHNLEAEEALLGSILIDPSMLSQIVLSAESFYLVKHRWIWEACQALTAEHREIDLLTIQEELDRREQLSEIGGPAYLTRLITLTPSAYHAPDYARFVAEASARRRLIQSAGEVARLAYDAGLDIETVKSAAIQAVLTSADSDYANSLQSIRQDAADLMDMVTEQRLGAGLLKTGLAPLDANIGGLDIDTLTYFAGRPGMSKTSLLLQICDLISERGELVLLFSKEMSIRQCLLRLACRRAHVSVQSLRNNTASSDDRDFVAQWLAEFTNRSTLFIDERKEQTTAQVRAECRKLEQRLGTPALIVADHLHLFTDPGENEVTRIGRISRGFKVLAGEMKTRVICAVQLNRGVEGRADDHKRPLLSDLRGSGQLEQDADNAFGLYRPAYYSRDPQDKRVEIINLKFRDGDVLATTHMNFESHYMSFERLP